MAPRFKNLDGSGPHSFDTVLKWAVGDKLAGRRRKSPSRAPVPRVEPDLAALATPPAPGQGARPRTSPPRPPPPRREPPPATRPPPPAPGAGARLTWLGHASWLVQLDGVSLLIDPVLRDAINVVIRRNVPSGVPTEKLPPITA